MFNPENFHRYTTEHTRAGPRSVEAANVSRSKRAFNLLFRASLRTLRRATPSLLGAADRIQTRQVVSRKALNGATVLVVEPRLIERIVSELRGLPHNEQRALLDYYQGAGDVSTFTKDCSLDTHHFALLRAHFRKRVCG